MLPCSTSSKKTTPGGGGAFTVRPTEALWLSEALVPVMVRVEAPTAAEAVVEMFRVLPENDPLAPEGRPLTLNETLPVNPPEGFTATMKLVDPPWTTDCEGGATVSEKSGLGFPPGREATHFLSALLHSACTRYPSMVALGSPAQMSPISPLALSYQPSGGPSVVATPTSGSVTVSAISCESTTVLLSITVLSDWQPPQLG